MHPREKFTARKETKKLHRRFLPERGKKKNGKVSRASVFLARGVAGQSN